MFLGNCCTTMIHRRGIFSPCCGVGMMPMPMIVPMNSCFGFGYYGFGGGCCGRGALEAGLGVGLGMAAGAALIPALPAICKGIGKAATWVGTKVIAPAAKGVWNGIKWVGKGIGKGFSAIGKGISNLWNKIFHKKSKKS